MKDTKRKMEIGIVGAGGVTKDLHLPVIDNIPEIQLKWICDINNQRARHLAKMYRIPQVFNNIEQCSDVDIVLLAIPVGSRAKIMETVFNREWNAFCEKPFAVTLAEHDQYISHARQINVQVGVGLVRRYGAATVMAGEIINKGFFGPIIEVWANEGMTTKRTGQEADWYMVDPKIVGGGVLMETGSHLVDQLCTILGVTGFRVDKCIQRAFNDLEFETRFIGALDTIQQDKIKCYLEVSRLEDLCNGIFIQFENFILKCGLFFEDPLELLTLNGDPITRFETNEGAKTIEQAFFLEWQDFIGQCISGKPSAVSANTARYSTAIIEQCYQNAEIIGQKNRKIENLNNG